MIRRIVVLPLPDAPSNNECFAFSDIEVDVLQDRSLAEAFADPNYTRGYRRCRYGLRLASLTARSPLPVSLSWSRSTVGSYSPASSLVTQTIRLRI
jgi:hypothetical protein